METEEELETVVRAINTSILGSDGHTTVSVKLDNGNILAIVGKKDPFIKDEDLVEIEPNGAVVRGNPTEEILVHLDIYRQWTNVNALIHSYPVSLVNLALGRVPMAENVEPEMLFQGLQVINSNPVDRHEMMEQIKDIFDVGVALVTTGFGLLMAGESLWEVFFRLQQLEELADRVTYKTVVSH
ncbi:class II aldolase/adducin family protein [Coprothermobacter platensis]|uniref:class II aldolase/adducin family protein n=1 Tax=Coprothermobacter platensis TaxID=108819 RepID=UPI00037CB292|nr:class II aldolase/adducin family protein [Coprothermobacter platensis]